MSVNSVTLLGNLGADPEVRSLSSGDTVTNFTVATTEKWKDKTTGERVEKTEWHRVVAFKRLGEICGEYLKKGSQVYVVGKNKTRKRQGQDGQDRYTTEVVIHEMVMLGSRDGAGSTQNAKPPQSRPPQQQAAAAPVPEYADFDDDIPF